MERTRKAQAATEYLMSYGWAVIVIVVVLAGLLYLGVFNVNAPELCKMPPEMSCATAYLSSASSNLSIKLVNGLQEEIEVTNISCTRNADQYEACTAGRCGGATVTMQFAQEQTFTLNCNDENGAAMAFAPGDSYDGKINVQYRSKNDPFANSRHISGNIVAKAG